MDGWWAASYVMLWILVATLCVIVVALARQIGALHLRLGPRGALELDDEGPSLGSVPEPAQLTSSDGDFVRVGGAGEAQLLLFVSPACPVCDQVLPAVRAVSEMSCYVLVDAAPLDTKRMLTHKRVHAPVISAEELMREYAIPGTPYAVVLDGEGVVRAKGTVNNLEQVEGLTETAKRRMGALQEA